MRISDCINNKDAALKSYEKLKKDHQKLNHIVTFVEPYINENDGKLKDVPIVIKDNVNTKGIKTTASSKILENYVPVYDATIINKLKTAGAVIVAKASMDELAMGGTNLSAATGPVKNPYDLTRISGGSSGGSAVSVSSGAVSVSIGSDTGDSVRKPASYNGIVGVKPTYGRISRYGVIPYASSLDHVGYFTTNIKDAALMLEVLAGRDDLDMTSSYEPVLEYSKLLNDDIKGKKIAIIKNVVDSLSDKKLVKMFYDLMDKLKEKGALIQEVSFRQDLMRALLPVYYVIANSEATANHSNLDGILFGNRQDADSMDDIMIKTRTNGFSTFVKKRFVIGSYSLFDENQERIFRKAQKIRRLIFNDIMSKMKDVDIIIAPAAPTGATKIDGTSPKLLNDEDLIADNYMVISNFCGLPSLTQPLGYLDDGLPVGVNLSANPFKEEILFDVAYAIEKITGLDDITKEDF